VQVLEVHNATAAGRLAAPNVTLSIKGLIVPDDTVETALISNFHPTDTYKNGTRPPNATWAKYAEEVKAGTPNPPVFP
jgi:hypothetical protein